MSLQHPNLFNYLTMSKLLKKIISISISEASHVKLKNYAAIYKCSVSKMAEEIISTYNPEITQKSVIEKVVDKPITPAML